MLLGISESLQLLHPKADPNIKSGRRKAVSEANDVVKSVNVNGTTIREESLRTSIFCFVAI